MRIVDVGTAVVRGNFDWVLVKVYTDSGLFGIGEAYWGAGVVSLIHRARDIIVGEEVTNINKCVERMIRGLSGEGSIGGATVTAISGIELALWDCVGKFLETPLYNLFGGKMRDKIRVYVDCHAGDDFTPESYKRKAQERKNEGWDAIKFDIDVPTPYSELKENEKEFWYLPYNRSLSNREIDYLVDIVAAVREGVGRDVDIAIDCHWKYSVKDAIRLLSALEDFDLLWVEDPVPPENVEALLEVQRNVRVPIATGENLYRKYGYRTLIEKQACRIVSPDIPKMGGLSEARKVFDMADVYYMPVAPHNVSSPVGTIAAAHLCAAMPNFLTIEFHAHEVEWWEDMVISDFKPLIRDGYINLPERPGIGLEINEVVVKEHLVEEKNFFKN
ncbi:MAG: galactonate dehydratase [Candidatus Atribacteria bacterium]|nr:galactonate dehydratase [Candidatus Atribacteria bacterium]